MNPMRMNTIVELTIDSIGFEGVAIGRLDGVVHFVTGALPGEVVRARVLRKKQRFVEAELVEVVEPSPERTVPPCPHFGACGGCKWQHLSYQQQIHWKRQHVIDAFERIGHVAVGTVHATKGCQPQFGYRNKMEFSFGGSKWLTNEQIASGETFDMSFALGLHVPKRFDKVLDIDHCLLQSDIGNTVLAATHALAREFGIAAYHQRRHDGFARNLVVRTSASTGAVMCVLITTTPSNKAEQGFVDAWMQQGAMLPPGSTLLHAVNDTWSPVAVGQIVRTEGPGVLEETSHGVTYSISPFSFFQTNTFQLPTLVGTAIDAAGISETDVVWDLYCGTGTLTLPAARQAKHVIGAELAASSIADAEQNAMRNGIGNVTFHALDLHSAKATPVIDTFERPDVILVDPPRAGMHAMLVEHLLRVAAPRIVYVSCNPATQARDCALLAEKYDVTDVTPVDMFPHTFHIESVAVLQRKPDVA